MIFAIQTTKQIWLTHSHIPIRNVYFQYVWIAYTFYHSTRVPMLYQYLCTKATYHEHMYTFCTAWYHASGTGVQDTHARIRLHVCTAGHTCRLTYIDVHACLCPFCVIQQPKLTKNSGFQVREDYYSSVSGCFIMCQYLDNHFILINQSSSVLINQVLIYLASPESVQNLGPCDST